jgi:hypothetical protein
MQIEFVQQFGHIGRQDVEFVVRGLVHACSLLGARSKDGRAVDLNTGIAVDRLVEPHPLGCLAWPAGSGRQTWPGFSSLTDSCSGPNRAYSPSDDQVALFGNPAGLTVEQLAAVAELIQTLSDEFSIASPAILDYVLGGPVYSKHSFMVAIPRAAALRRLS